ncbi:MAG: phospholipid/cholesterol/gamma-HCH transport system substrate-binding protein, partial [Frankiaceae bacterium]|nr:phospholipid/cholesterol/gamma-HCH transport system substrate-binding protein [Frankiaceae bacterium]
MTRPITWLRGLRTARRITLLVVAAVLAALGATGVALASGGGGGGSHHLTAMFTRTIGLYKGNDVRILGVKVGKIDKLTVKGTSVEVQMTVEGKYPLPQDVQAVIVPPSVVSDRYIQLTPAFTGGPQLEQNATLGTDRTQVPLEFDEIFRNLDQLNNALGPNGANKHGALSRLIDVSAANLGGNGQALNGALKEFSAAISTLAGSRTDLFSTVGQLQRFTTMLARNDGGVRAVNANLAKVGNQLAGERADLGAALANLSTALQQVNSFVRDNKTTLTSDIHRLTSVTGTLVGEKEALKEIIDMAPFALTNLALAADPRARTLDTKDDAQQPLVSPTGPNGALCQLLPPLCLATKSNG